MDKKKIENVFFRTIVLVQVGPIETPQRVTTLVMKLLNIKVERHFNFFFHPPSSGITPCVGPTKVVLDLTLDAALLFVVNREGVTTSSRAGTDLGLLLDGGVDASPS